MNSHERWVARPEAVTHRYRSVLALDEITLDIPAGSLVGVIGPDGIGKSTLLSIIAGARRYPKRHGCGARRRHGQCRASRAAFVRGSPSCRKA